MSGPGWYSFGRGTHGELGRRVSADGEALENADVRPIELEEGVEIETIACGHFHNIALSTDHQVFAWGANSHGQLGTEEEAWTPTAAWQLQALLGQGQISHLSAGRNHSVFVTSSGRSFISGRLPSAEPGVSKVTSAQAVRQIQVTDGSEEPEGQLVAGAAGESQTFFLSSEGELWSWLGEEDRNSGERRRILGHFQRPTARAVLGLPRVAEVTCGLHHTLILTEERKIFSFGAGSLGQLGLGPCRRCPTPTQVIFPPQCDGCLCGIAAGFASSFAVTEQGWVYSWGCNEKCELGLGTALRGAARPKPIDALYQVKVVQVSAGFAHTACVTDSGLLYLWGYGAYGQLGFGFDDLRSSMRLGAGWSASKPSGVDAGDAGFRSTNQSQPWQQVWPRRCRRGPFKTRRCVRVECGAYHTIAKASKVLLAEDARKESEVLCPLPLEVSDLPAGTMALMEADQQWPPGAGLAECPRPVLRQKAPRTVEIFRSLADLFWDTKPRKAALPLSVPRETPSIEPKEGPRWRRALKPPQRLDGANTHPLHCDSHHSSPRTPQHLKALPLPTSGVTAMATWNEVDEAVHKAFTQGDVAAPLSELMAELLEVAGPRDGGFTTGLPASPSQGLARMECLTPRPFYLPEQEPDLTNISGAPVPVEAEDAGRAPIMQIVPEVLGDIDQQHGEPSEDQEEKAADEDEQDHAAESSAVDRETQSESVAKIQEDTDDKAENSGAVPVPSDRVEEEKTEEAEEVQKDEPAMGTGEAVVEVEEIVEHALDDLAAAPEEIPDGRAADESPKDGDAHSSVAGVEVEEAELAAEAAVGDALAKAEEELQEAATVKEEAEKAADSPPEETRGQGDEVGEETAEKAPDDSLKLSEELRWEDNVTEEMQEAPAASAASSSQANAAEVSEPAASWPEKGKSRNRNRRKRK